MSAQTKNLVLTNQVFVCLGQAITGPVTIEEAKRWAEANWTRPDAFVWCEGFTSWVAVTTFAQLRPEPKITAATVNHLTSVKPVAMASEGTATNFTNPGFTQPWTYPSNDTTQVTRTTQTGTHTAANTTVRVQTQNSPNHQTVPVYQQSAPIQQPVPIQQPSNVYQHQQPTESAYQVAQATAPIYQQQQAVAPQPVSHQPPVYQAPIVQEPLHQGFAQPQMANRASKSTPPKTTLPERVRRLPEIDQIPIDPVVLRTAASRGAQIAGVFVVFGLIYLGVTKLPLREFSTYIQNAANKATPAPANAPETKIAESKPVPQPRRAQAETKVDPYAVAKTLSRFVAMDSPVEKAAKSRAFQRNFDSLSPDGKFWKENVPLGIKLNQLQGALTECQLDRPEGAAGFWPLTSYDPPIRDFFPLKEGVYKGLSIYFGWVGGLASRHAEHFEMRCNGEETFDLFFNKTSKTLFAYAKTITLSAETPVGAIKQVEVEMAKYCNGPVQEHKAYARDRRSGPVEVHVRYCQYADMVIVAASDAVAAIQNNLAQVNLAYVSGKGWKEYLAAVEKTEKRLPASN
jgi:hypothetical protein